MFCAELNVTMPDGSDGEISSKTLDRNQQHGLIKFEISAVIENMTIGTGII